MHFNDGGTVILRQIAAWLAYSLCVPVGSALCAFLQYSITASFHHIGETDYVVVKKKSDIVCYTVDEILDSKSSKLAPLKFWENTGCKTVSIWWRLRQKRIMPKWCKIAITVTASYRR